MIAFRFILELLIFCICGLGPGLFALRRVRCQAMEKLCLSIGLSWIVVYLAATGIYLAHFRVAWHFAVSGLCLALLICSAGQLKKLWSNRQVRRAVAGFAVLVLWNVLLMSVVRHFSGGNWFGDWYEHYRRTLFFLDYLPGNTRFLHLYDLPARPPMMNLLCAHFLAQAGQSYDLYQVAMLLLNLLVYFPCVLIADALARRGRRQLPLLVVFLAGSPLLVQNLSYTWTKLLAGFYVILGTWLYLRGWRKQDPFRVAAAFVALSAGLLVHYSAGPYLLFFALHYAVVLRKRKHPGRELATAAMASGLLLASWFAWSIGFYGLKTTVASNTPVIDSEKLSLAENLRKMGSNVFYSLVPQPLQFPLGHFERFFWQPNPLGHVRDHWFLTYQQVLPTTMGILGGLLVVYLLVVNFRHAKDGAMRAFWLWMIVFCVLVGIAVHGAEEPLGVAEICLQPLTLLGLTFLAAAFTQLPVLLRHAAAVFVVFDFCMGIFLQVHMQRLLFDTVPAGLGRIIPLRPDLLCVQAVINSVSRVQQQLPFWADHFRDWSEPIQLVMVACVIPLLHPLALAARGRERRWRQRPTGFFYVLLALLLGGVAYCGRDQWYGASSRAAPKPPSNVQLLQAIADASRTVQANPDSSAAQTVLGEALYNDARSEAFDALAEAFMLDPNNLRPRYILALFLWQISPDVAASTMAAEDVFEHPDSGKAQLRLGKRLLAKHHPGPALVHLSESVRLSGASADALYALGVACVDMQDREHLEPAVGYLSAALRLKPDFPDAEQALRQCLSVLGYKPDDIEAFVQHARSGP